MDVCLASGSTEYLLSPKVIYKATAWIRMWSLFIHVDFRELMVIGCYRWETVARAIFSRFAWQANNRLEFEGNMGEKCRPEKHVWAAIYVAPCHAWRLPELLLTEAENQGLLRRRCTGQQWTLQVLDSSAMSFNPYSCAAATVTATRLWEPGDSNSFSAHSTAAHSGAWEPAGDSNSFSLYSLLPPVRVPVSTPCYSIPIPCVASVRDVGADTTPQDTAACC
uniref:Uncharacterized protein n=1 Tax=Aegilops tauschii TaxID=37682 RepID=M8AR08_AEGTA